MCLGHLKRWSQAAEAFGSAVQVDGTRTEALLGLGIALIHSGRPADALEALDRYLLVGSDSEPALFAKAVALQQTGRPHVSGLKRRNPITSGSSS